MTDEIHALYRDNNNLTLILKDQSVYRIIGKNKVIRSDFRMNPVTPYLYLGKKITVEELKDVLLKEKVITLINL